MTYFIELDKKPHELPPGGYELLKIHTKEDARKWAEENKVVVYWINPSCVLQEKDDFNPS